MQLCTLWLVLVTVERTLGTASTDEEDTQALQAVCCGRGKARWVCVMSGRAGAHGRCVYSQVHSEHYAISQTPSPSHSTLIPACRPHAQLSWACMQLAVQGISLHPYASCTHTHTSPLNAHMQLQRLPASQMPGTRCPWHQRPCSSSSKAGTPATYIQDDRHCYVS